MSDTKLSKAFVTGCDQNTEWMLPWFLDNYFKHNNTTMVVANFGMSKEMLNTVNNYAVGVLDMTSLPDKGWFKKPMTMLTMGSKSEYTCWIDTDCEVFGDISGVFDYVEDNKLAMVEDKPWSKRRGETWHNSGIVAFKNTPIILHKWTSWVRENPEVGDQEVLHQILRTDINRLIHITNLPNKYNWLRLQVLDGDEGHGKLVQHHTGGKGKDEIRRLMK